MLVMEVRFIFYTLATTVLMCAALTDARSDEDYKEQFGYIDVDGDGFITEENLLQFMASDSSVIIATDRDAFRIVMKQAIKNCGDGKMDVNSYTQFMKKKDAIPLETRLKNVRSKFPKKEDVSREELASKLGIDPSEFHKETYSITQDLAYMYLF
ncbi:hypothetical protein LSTR_LSTR005972 [Laodelphax striatellus]|uniref:EF-hand domain-containing protein n=1 Tax=Laodelphax striatellus TaxID=195883 RepID=A0A482WF32_LAOST|nr:hypothetical protein LSTR_LSTR005972 [Laodelphax striatellus]